MQSSLHWSEKRTSFSLLFIMEFTSWNLDSDKMRKDVTNKWKQNFNKKDSDGGGVEGSQMTEWALMAVSLALLSRAEILAYPMMNMSMFPSETFGPNRNVMSSGGTADPTFHVTMYTLTKG